MYGRGQSPGIGFGPPVTPPVVKQLLIANIAVFVAQVMTAPVGDVGASPLAQYGSVRPMFIWGGGFMGIWQAFTYMWLHGSFLHLAMNMFGLWMFGAPLALVWGAKRFLRYYLLCGVGAGVIIAVFPYVTYTLGIPTSLTIPTLGASGAIYGVLLAYSLTWPDRTIMLIFPPVAFRAIWLIPGLFFMTMIAMPGSNVSHIGHLGGVIVGWLYLRRRGEAGSLVSVSSLRHRWRRYRMRQKLRAIRYEDHTRDQDRRDRDQRLH